MEGRMTPNTDIVIPVFGSREFPVEDCLEKCVETVQQHTQNFRFIFVDDGSDEVCSTKINKIAAFFPESNVVRSQRQRWFTRAVNLGLRLVRTTWAVELNLDVVVDKGWLDELYDVKDEVEKTVGRVGIVGSQLSGEEPRRYDITMRTKPPQDYV